MLFDSGFRLYKYRADSWNFNQIFMTSFHILRQSRERWCLLPYVKHVALAQVAYKERGNVAFRSSVERGKHVALAQVSWDATL